MKTESIEYQDGDVTILFLLPCHGAIETARGYPPHLQRGITSLANSSIERLTVAWSISPP